jgi:PPM family protein phosphatase
MAVQLRFGAASDVGRVRSANQDSWLAHPDRALFVVADGMGGHQGGEVASSMAVEIIDASYDEPSAEGIVAALERANEAIHGRGASEPDLRGMGTTAVVAVLVDERGTGTDGDPGQQLVIANIGDSRAYLYRAGELIQLTEDHSMVADLVREGRISPEEAEHHPQRNIVTRVLGVYSDIDVDLWPVDPARGDRFLLCSDGLFNEVGEEQIGAVLRRLDDPSEAADELVRLANEGGGRDNTTVIVLDVVDDGGAAQSASAAVGGAASSGRPADPDVAGFTTAATSGSASSEPAERPSSGGPVSARASAEGRADGEPAARTQRSRFTWRVALFVLLVLAVIGGAYATIVWYGTGAYYVGFDGADRVAIYKGRPGGVLWIDPELEERTRLGRDDVPERYVPDIEAGREHGSLDDARSYIERISDEAGVDPETGTTTTTTTTRPPRTTTTTERPGRDRQNQPSGTTTTTDST